MDPRDPEHLTALLGRRVRSVETEEAPMAGLERIVALCLEGGVRFPLPAGNRLRTGGDLAEIRALLEGWPRSSAARLKAHLGSLAPGAATARIDAILAAWAREPELEAAPPERWPDARGGRPS